MSNIAPTSAGSQYTDNDRRAAAANYVVLGNMTKVSELTGIAQTTLSEWKNKTDWWVECTLH